MPDKNVKFDGIKSQTTNRFKPYNGRLSTNQFEDRLKAVKPLMIDDKQIKEKIGAYMKEQNAANLSSMLTGLAVVEVIVPSVVGKDKRARPVFLRDSAGQPWLPAYTSYGRLPQGDDAPRSQALTKVPFMTADEMAVRSNCSGIIVNPFTDNMFIKAELCRKMIQIEADKRKGVLDRRQAAKEMMAADAAEIARQQKAAQEDAQDMANGRGEEIVANIQITRPDGKKRVLHLTEQQYDIFMRQQVDFTLLPKKFFADGQALVDDLSDRGVEAVDSFYEDSYGLKRMYPYVLDDFNVMALDINDDLTVVQIEMPRRNLVIPCALRVYLAWKPAEKTGRYFSVELTQERDVRRLSEVRAAGEDAFARSTILDDIQESAELQTVVDLMTQQSDHTDDGTIDGAEGGDEHLSESGQAEGIENGPRADSEGISQE